MTVISASEAHVPREILNKVVYGGERITIKRYNKVEAVIISKEDYELLETLEDLYSAKLSDEAVAKMKQGHRKPIPWDDLKKELNL
jgi:prevent-host-death family protein